MTFLKVIVLSWHEKLSIKLWHDLDVDTEMFVIFSYCVGGIEALYLSSL